MLLKTATVCSTRCTRWALDATVLVNTLGSNQQEISTGTGFVYKTDDKYGYILTNNHVIKDGKTITVVMSNDEEVDGKVYIRGSEISTKTSNGDNIVVRYSYYVGTEFVTSFRYFLRFTTIVLFLCGINSVLSTMPLYNTLSANITPP